MTAKTKSYETIGCCGIDCGLCPRFHARGNSACPGCGGEGFREKHPACGVHSCCAVKNGYEVCSECPEYPCRRLSAGMNGHDSFVTHRRMAPNLDAIKAGGIGPFIGEQGIRIDILKDLLARHNDGHSKNYYCLGCALLPLGTLQEIHALADTLPTTAGPKERCIVIRGAMAEASVYMEIDLRLHTKP